MKFIIFIGIILSGRVLFSQVPGIEWQKCLGGSTVDGAKSVQQTSDGGYIVAGFTTSNNGDVSGNHGGYDARVVKLNSSGAITWQKCLGGSLDDWANSIQQTSDGGYIMAGYVQSNDGDVSGNHGWYDAWVVKLSSSGSITWQKCLGGMSIDQAESIQQTSDGGYIVAGATSSNNGDVSGNHGENDAWVVKLNSVGSITWQKCLGGSLGEWAYSIQQTSDQGYIVAGHTWSNDADVSGNHGSTDAWVVKLNSSGSIAWQKCLGGTLPDVAYSIQQTPDGGYTLAGYAKSNDFDVSGNHGDLDAWVVKLNSSGSITWQKCLGGTELDLAYSIQQTSDDGYIMAGFTWSNDGDVEGNHGVSDHWLVKLNSSGAITWQKCLGGTDGDEAWAVQQTMDDYFIIAGCSSSNDGDVGGNHGGGDGWVVKLGISPCPSLNATSVVTDPSCNGSSNGSINIIPPGNGAPPYAYEWSNGANTEDINNLLAGAYLLTITDQSDCVSYFNFTLTDPSVMNISLSIGQITCFDESNGSLSANPSGGVPGYTYLWSNGANTHNITNLSAGMYSVTVSDANLCTKTSSFFLTQPAELTTSFTFQNVTCFSDSNGLANALPTGGSPGYSYEWSTGDYSSSISNLSPGLYTVTITDINGCIDTNSINISAPPDLTLIFSPQNISCYGAMNGMAIVTTEGGSPGYSYSWSNGSTNDTIYNLNSGTYIVTVTDTHACTKTSAVFITEPTELVLTLSGNEVSCFGNSNGWIHAQVVGGVEGYSYLWSNGMSTDSLEDLSAGNYGLTITDASGCTNSSVFEILSPSPLSVTIISANTSSFGGSDGSALAEVYGGTPIYTYLWSTGDTTGSINNLPAGNYSVTITDTNGCEFESYFEINQPDCGLPIEFQAYVNPISCRNQNDASITIDTSNITPPFSIIWSTGDSTASLNNLGEGDYSVTLTDFNGCQAVDTFQIRNPENLSVAILEVHDVTAPDSSNGSIVINVSGGTPPYAFKWLLNDSIVSTDQNPTHLAAGTFMLILSDGHNCAYVGNEVMVGIISGVTIPSNPVISIYPNPVSDILNITSDRKIDVYKIFNMDGRMMRSERIDAVTWKVDMSEAMAGVYFLVVFSDGKIYITNCVVEN